MTAPASTSRSPSAGGGRGSVVPDAAPRTYYDRPVVKPPVWKPEVPWYFFSGGLAGGSSLLAAAADLVGDRDVARAARRVAAAGAVASPALLIADLGVPRRFLNMLRVFRPTSPLNVGSWLLAAYVPSAVAAAVLGELGRLPALQRLAQGAATVGAAGMTTYTAVLVADTAVPVWHDARRELPFVFAGSAGASAGAAALLATPHPGGIAARLAVLGVVMEQAATAAMERRLGEVGAPYHEGRAGRFASAAKGLSVAGAALVAGGSRRRPLALAGAALTLAGAACARWAVFAAGFQSARRPQDTIAPQRARLDGDGSGGGGG